MAHITARRKPAWSRSRFSSDDEADEPKSPVWPSAPADEPKNPVWPSRPADEPKLSLWPSRPADEPKSPVWPSAPADEPKNPLWPSAPADGTHSQMPVPLAGDINVIVDKYKAQAGALGDELFAILEQQATQIATLNEENERLKRKVENGDPLRHAIERYSRKIDGLKSEIEGLQHAPHCLWGDINRPNEMRRSDVTGVYGGRGETFMAKLVKARNTHDEVEEPEIKVDWGAPNTARCRPCSTKHVRFAKLSREDDDCFD